MSCWYRVDHRLMQPKNYKVFNNGFENAIENQCCLVYVASSHLAAGGGDSA